LFIIRLPCNYQLALHHQQIPTMATINQVHVESPNIEYQDDVILSSYKYNTSKARVENDRVIVTPKEENYFFRTERKVPRLGVLVIGLGGNNGSTVVAGIIANREYVSQSSSTNQPICFLVSEHQAEFHCTFLVVSHSVTQSVIKCHYSSNTTVACTSY
jgi:hypothetical protein